MNGGTWPDGGVARIEIDIEEWLDASNLLGMTTAWEDRSTGYIRLRAIDGRREWVATDLVTLTRRLGRADDGDFSHLLPPRLVNAAPSVAGAATTTELFVLDRQNSFDAFILRGDAGEVWVPRRDMTFPDTDWWFETVGQREVDTTISAVKFATALRVLPWEPQPLGEDGRHPKVTLASDSEGFSVMMTWPDEGPTLALIDDRPARRDISIEAGIEYLRDVARQFTDSIDVSFGDDPDEAVYFRGDDVDVVLMPIYSGLEKHRNHVESVIREVFGPDAVNRDEDGDYLLKTFGVPVWGRLYGADPATLRVFASVAVEIGMSPELLAELNSINSSISFAKVEWSNDIVTVSSDLVASTIDREELFNAFARVNSLAENTGALIVSMFGGRDLNRDAERWNDYLQTDVVAEIVPESYIYVNGENATEDWPFSGSA